MPIFRPNRNFWIESIGKKIQPDSIKTDAFTRIWILIPVFFLRIISQR